MTKRLTITLTDSHTLKMLEQMENLKLLTIEEALETNPQKIPLHKLMGSMKQQPLAEVDAQLKELRDAWD